jgi:hypothetical protein
VGVVHQTVQNRIGQGWVAEVIVPMLHG